MDGWLEYIGRVRTRAECTILFAQLDAYRNGTGMFSHQLALDKSHQAKPVSWWEHFGCKTRELQALAIRVLSQDCSTGVAERNWSAHSLAHTKKRNRLTPTQLERLVFIRENLRMMHKFESGTNEPMQVSPDEVDVEKNPDVAYVVDDLDRELYKNFVDEIMDCKRITRSKIVAARADSSYEEVSPIEPVSNQRGRSRKRRRLCPSNENIVVRRSSRLAGRIIATADAETSSHEANASTSAQVQHNLEVEEVVNCNINVAISDSDNDDNYEEVQEDSADIDSTETELSDED